MQSVSRACIPDHLVIQNKVEVFIGICFYQMILSPYLEGFRISKFLNQFASANGYMMLYLCQYRNHLYVLMYVYPYSLRVSEDNYLRH